tara:strand:- start:76 stop:534 length:459 start_codon:yes stop_codon:yes gene_type:complete
MKTLNCLLITTLLVATSYGADKILPSLNGLEGYGENGLSASFSPKHNPNPLLKTHAENILKKAGFKINEASGDHIWLAIIPINKGDKKTFQNSHMHIYRNMDFTTKAGKRYRFNSVARAYGSDDPAPNSEMELLDSIIKQFINDWRKANTKK